MLSLSAAEQFVACEGGHHGIEPFTVEQTLQLARAGLILRIHLVTLAERALCLDDKFHAARAAASPFMFISDKVKIAADSQSQKYRPRLARFKKASRTEEPLKIYDTATAISIWAIQWPKTEPSQTGSGSVLYPMGGPPSNEITTRDSPLTLCDRAPCAGRIAQKAAQSAGLTTAL